MRTISMRPQMKYMKKGPRRLNVLLVGVEEGFRGMLKEFLEFGNLMTVVGEVPNGLGVSRVIRSLKPDCVLFDLSVPDVERVRDAREAKERFPRIAVALLTDHDAEHYTALAHMIGVDAVFKKDFIVSELPGLLKQVKDARSGMHAKKHPLQPRVVGALAK